MSIYDELTSVVSEVMSEFKQGSIKLVSITPGTGPADEPGEPTESLTTLDAVARGVSSKYVKDGLALASDLMVSAAVVAGVTPKNSDFIEIDSVRYKIVQIMNLPAAGTKLVWKFIVRKGG